MAILALPPDSARTSWARAAGAPVRSATIATARPRSFALEVPRLLLGRPARRDRLLEAVAEEVELKAPRAFGFFLDGEIDTAPGRLLVRVGPRVALVHA